MARNPQKKRCKARNRSGERCKNWAKPGWDVCYYHGAGGGAPPEKMIGNKNALKTGEYETIWLDTLDDEERVFFSRIDTDVARQLDEEIRLMTIRERRMMRRIQELRQQTQVLEDVTESDEMGVTTRYVAALIRIQQIEEALTRVQEKKTRLLELKHKVASTSGDGDDALAGLVEAIRESARAAAADTDDADGGEE